MLASRSAVHQGRPTLRTIGVLAWDAHILRLCWQCGEGYSRCQQHYNLQASPHSCKLPTAEEGRISTGVARERRQQLGWAVPPAAADSAALRGLLGC